MAVGYRTLRRHKMAYSELIKNYNRIRDYMREFYVYGFKSRDEYTKKSSRSYDDERRRLESWLGDYMQFRRSSEGKNVFLSIDSRVLCHNPLYKAWKAKSFTDGDITLHFILMDILADCEEALSLNKIVEKVYDYLSAFEVPKTFDESTIRKKLKEYVSEGIVQTEKAGKEVRYKRTESVPFYREDVIDYFSETAPCGVIGSFLLDKMGSHNEMLAFKHHYITGALDSDIVCSLFVAMRGKRNITMETTNRQKDTITENHVVPLRIMISAQSGRQYLMAYVPRFKRITSFRIDSIEKVKIDEECPEFDERKNTLNSMLLHMWGVSTNGRSGEHMEHVEFTVRYEDHERHIPQRLEREKRCGTVERIDDNTCRFSADVFDSSELIPWIRTFICRITEIRFSDKRIEESFKKDIEDMYRLYDMEGGEGE